MSALRCAVVATEDDPARAEWVLAAEHAGVAEPRFVSWSAISSSDSEPVFQPGEVVFVERLHPRTSGNPVGGHRPRHLELAVALERLDAAVAKAGATLAAAVEPTLLALDRTTRDDFLRQNGVPVLAPSDLSAAEGNIMRPRFSDSDDWLIDGRRTRLFRHRTRQGFEVWRAPGESFSNKSELVEIATLLADDEIHAVADLHRAYLTDSFYDIRFAVLDGRATHAAGVAREGAVHLREWYGGRRAEFDTFFRRFGTERWERLVALAERTATFFPGIRSLGVDLCLDNDSAEYVFDVDPFGAFLPGLAGGLPNAAGKPATVRAAVLRLLSGGS